MPDATTRLYFDLFNEVGILSQLSTALFEARLPDGMLISHFSVLNLLVRVSDGRTPLDLARAFQVPKTTMTHTLSGLVSHGLVEMRPNPDDGRSKRVWLTPEGRQFRETAIEGLAPDIAWISAAFPAERVEAALEQLRVLRKVLDTQRS